MRIQIRTYSNLRRAGLGAKKALRALTVYVKLKVWKKKNLIYSLDDNFYNDFAKFAGMDKSELIKAIRDLRHIGWLISTGKKNSYCTIAFSKVGDGLYEDLDREELRKMDFKELGNVLVALPFNFNMKQKSFVTGDYLKTNIKRHEKPVMDLAAYKAIKRNPGLKKKFEDGTLGQEIDFEYSVPTLCDIMGISQTMWYKRIRPGLIASERLSTKRRHETIWNMSNRKADGKRSMHRSLPVQRVDCMGNPYMLNQWGDMIYARANSYGIDITRPIGLSIIKRIASIPSEINIQYPEFPPVDTLGYANPALDPDMFCNWTIDVNEDSNGKISFSFEENKLYRIEFKEGFKIEVDVNDPNRFKGHPSKI